MAPQNAVSLLGNPSLAPGVRQAANKLVRGLQLSEDGRGTLPNSMNPQNEFA